MPDSRRWCPAGKAQVSSTTDSSPAATAASSTPGTSIAQPADLDALEVIDCQRRWITPGLIDCHTHLVYAGDRAHEFEQRLNGVSYEAIARAGGGILSTVNATRAASETELLAASLPRLDALLAEGVTTVEIKSGYGLALEHERKQLRVARALGQERAVTVRTTFLGAHAVPPEFAGRADDYIAEVAGHMLPALANEGLVDAVDAFCENIGFTRDQTRRVFNAATLAGLRVKLHAEQLSNMRGAEAAAGVSRAVGRSPRTPGRRRSPRHGGLGHRRGAVARAFYFLRDTRVPPLEALRAAGVPIAIATDCNPGTSHYLPCSWE
jgi:imidazolonepropionase